MPATYTDSVREFERLLREMRRTSDQHGRYNGLKLRTLAFHLEGYYTTSERIIRLRAVLKPNRKGKPVQMRNHLGEVVTRPQIEYRRHPDAQLERAELALRWIAEHWALGHEPFLPRELTEELRVAA